jgi:uncharacterized membrane protein
MDWVLLVKWVHVISSTVLFGTGLGIAYFFWIALRGPDVKLAAGVAKLVVKADWTFTLPAGMTQIVTGLALMHLEGFALSDRWLTQALCLFTLALACWLPVVWLQIRLRDMLVNAAASNTPLPAQFNSYLWRWFALGWPAFAALLYVFYLMIAKPV